MNILEYVKLQHPDATIRNWAPYATEMLQKGFDVEFPAGVFELGDQETPAATEIYAKYPSNRRAIVWGWGPQRLVRISGAGPGKTILKVVDNLVTDIHPGKQIHRLLLSRGEGEKDAFDCPAIVEGITFDGNMRGNGGRFTTAAMRIIGTGTMIRDCEFTDFGPGGYLEGGTAQHTPECFTIAAGLPSNAPQMSKGPVVLRCHFRNPARKRISPRTYTTENTMVALGGNMVYSIMASGVRVEGCTFSGDFDRVDQQAPLHAITVSSCVGAVIRENTFTDYEGICVYADSGSQWGTVVENNTARNVWLFVQYSCQNWIRQGSSSWQIPRYDGIRIQNNDVTLSSEPTTYAWDAPDGRSSFMGYLYDRDLDPSLYPGFVDVVVDGNKVVIPPDSTFVANYGGHLDGGWKPGSVTGDVPGIIVGSNWINPTPEPASVRKEVEEVKLTLNPSGSGKATGLVVVAVILAAL